MKIQHQVCTYEQGLKLRELGINYKQANFYWEKRIFENPAGFGIFFHYQKPHILGDEHKPNFAPAFTVAELGVMMNLQPDGGPDQQTWNDQLHDKVIELLPKHKLEATFRADILIYAIENGFAGAEVDQINQRLIN